MAKIKFAQGDEATVIQRNADESSGGHAYEFRPVFGENDELELFEVNYGPNASVPSHAHLVDEIIYVLEGSLIVGSRHYGPGSAVLVPAWTLYSFRTGEEGLRFANFRPRFEARRLVSKDEFMDERKARSGDGAPSEAVEVDEVTA